MISVIMPMYNEPLEYISKSVNSILNQTFKKIELIIIVDNPCRKDIIEYVKRIKKHDTRIKIIINHENIGITGSLNRGIDLAKGEYIARMDADDISSYERLNKQMKYLQKFDYDLVGCNVIKIDGNGEMIAEERSKFPSDDQSIKKYMQYNNAMAHPTWLGKTEIFRKYKYINYYACEDYEFLTRLILDGKKIGNMDECLLKYRINNEGISSSKTNIQKLSFMYIRNNFRNGRKSNYGKYMRYIRGDSGKGMMRKIEKYYKYSSKIKCLLNSKRYILSLMYCIVAVLTNGIARDKIICSMKCRRIVKGKV